MFVLNERVRCQDGTTVSVQASRLHYCTPRTDCDGYTAVEVGYPSAQPPESWRQYFDGENFDTQGTSSVYGYVPYELVDQFIADHGGMVAGSLPPKARN